MIPSGKKKKMAPYRTQTGRLGNQKRAASGFRKRRETPCCRAPTPLERGATSPACRRRHSRQRGKEERGKCPGRQGEKKKDGGPACYFVGRAGTQTKTRHARGARKGGKHHPSSDWVASRASRGATPHRGRGKIPHPCLGRERSDEKKGSSAVRRREEN